MTPRREFSAFAAALAVLVAGFFAGALGGGKVLSPADVFFVSASFRDVRGAGYEPANRLLMDPVLQFQPWLEFNRAMLRRGRLPLWNDRAGCGAPHLANGQSAVFDPFQRLADLGTLPEALAWMAAARLWMAGIGMFLLARAWGLGPWGRWFAGLVFPFCGFLVAWLLFPVTNVAIWMPWLFWASDCAWRRPGPRAVGLLALVTGCVLVGGHVQTSAHVLIAVGLDALWRLLRGRGEASVRAGLAAWVVGVGLGIGVGAVEIVPLGSYLTRSPVWSDRDSERPPVWALTRPRFLDAVCTALPYAFGSQRRGQPNLAKALGVHNLNESAAGFAGLATLLWLAPLALSARGRQPRVGFLAGLVLVGASAAFGLPPVEQLLRLVPVVNVTDNRRLTLWVAFGLTLLGGFGLDQMAELRARGPRGVRLWIVAACVLLTLAAGAPRAGPIVHSRALAHYARAANETPGADPEVYRARADRQTRQITRFVPLYLGLASAHLLALAGLAVAWRRGRIGTGPTRLALLSLTLVDLFAFGVELNPALARADDRPETALIAHLRRTVGPSGRILGIGEELPPNVLMRYGLADVRNYDSIELARSLDWFAPLFEPGKAARTSRRSITWAGVLRARDRLEGAGVAAVVGANAPPIGTFDRVEKVGAVWIARLDPVPWAALEDESSTPPRVVTRDPGSLRIVVSPRRDTRLIIRETFDPGWRAFVDGRPVAVRSYLGTWLTLTVDAGVHEIMLRYEPPEVAFGLGISGISLALAVFALTGFHPFRSTRIMAWRLGRAQAAELESVS